MSERSPLIGTGPAPGEDEPAGLLGSYQRGVRLGRQQPEVVDVAAAVVLSGIGYNRNPPPVARSRTAHSLAGWAARLLPAPRRAEWSEVFRSELLEIASRGRFAQLAYGLRVVARAPRLRWALRTPKAVR